MKEILPELNLGKQNQINIKEISGGQRQRLSFGRAIISNFSVLFADEPKGNLDCCSAEKIMDILSNQINLTHSLSYDLPLII